MFSARLLHPHKNLHGTVHTDTAKISQEALQVGTLLSNWHWGREGRGILLQRDDEAIFLEFRYNNVSHDINPF